MRRYKVKRQRTLIIISSLILLFVFTVSYAAFNTSLNIGVKGNVKNINAGILKSRYCNQTSGDGLYKDIYDENKCIYKGGNPNNYIKFDNSLWRIISIEADNSIKLIKNDSIGNMEYDKPGYRNVNTSTFCTKASTTGCNAWAISDNYYNCGTVTQNSSINDYLNTTYLNSINDKNYIVNSDFNVGYIFLGLVDTPFDNYFNTAKSTLWNGKVALLSINEYALASLDSNCKTPYYLSLENSACNKQNFIYCDYGWWTLNPTSISQRSWAWRIDESGKMVASDTNVASNIRPVIYLSSDISLNGSGTLDNPYTIN